jgi:sRNA-binding regulator protein Hfq
MEQQRDQLHPRPGFRREERRPSGPKIGPKGHDAVLKALQDSGRLCTIVKASSGDKVVGKIVGRDKFTITLLVDGVRRVIYKHAIEEFFGEEAPATAQ